MSEQTAPNLGIRHGWNLGETGWNTGADANWVKLDTLLNCSVLDRDLATPPGSPAVGDRYIVGASATGAWAGKEGQIALYINAGWAFYVPKKGWPAYVVDEDAIVVCNAVSPSVVWSAGHKLNRTAGADQAAVTLGNADNEIGGLTISAAYNQPEVQALRDKCEELADDVRALSTLVHSVRTALMNVNVIKGSA